MSEVVFGGRTFFVNVIVGGQIQLESVLNPGEESQRNRKSSGAFGNRTFSKYSFVIPPFMMCD